jgi:F0F1-type ATP synthase assembly protein I
MKREKLSTFRSLAVLSSMGISSVLAVVIGVWFGLTLDSWLGTKPWFFFIFLFFGIAAGFKNIYVISRREIHRDDGSNS